MIRIDGALKRAGNFARLLEKTLEPERAETCRTVRVLGVSSAGEIVAAEAGPDPASRRLARALAGGGRTVPRTSNSRHRMHPQLGDQLRRPMAGGGYPGGLDRGDRRCHPQDSGAHGRPCIDDSQLSDQLRRCPSGVRRRRWHDPPVGSDHRDRASALGRSYRLDPCLGVQPGPSTLGLSRSRRHRHALGRRAESALGSTSARSPRHRVESGL